MVCERLYSCHSCGLSRHKTSYNPFKCNRRRAIVIQKLYFPFICNCSTLLQKRESSKPINSKHFWCSRKQFLILYYFMQVYYIHARGLHIISKILAMSASSINELMAVFKVHCKAVVIPEWSSAEKDPPSPVHHGVFCGNTLSVSWVTLAGTLLKKSA